MTEKGKKVKVIVSQRIAGAIMCRVAADEPIGSSDISYDIGRCKKCGAEVTQWEMYFSSHVCPRISKLSPTPQGLCTQK